MSSTATATRSMAMSTPAKERDSVAEVMGASMVGTAIEFYDNYCYSIAAASYFGTIFFTDVAKSDPLLATIMAFVTFAVSFIARPFGSLLFGHFGDKLGRKKTLVVALMMMGIATFTVGLLPGYEQLGTLAVVLLCVCRACQGIGLAGEWSGAALVATENAPAGKRAIFGAFPNMGAPIGFFLAYGINLLLDTNLSSDVMVAWGWRIPFLLSAVLVIVGLVIRLRMSETPVFKKAVEENRTTRTPLRDLRHYWKQVVLGMCAISVTYTLFYSLGTWSLAYGVKSLGFTQSQYLSMELFAVLFFAAFIVVGCLSADRFGRKRTLYTATAAMLVFSLVCPQLLTGTQNFAGVLAFLCVGFSIMGALFGPCGAYLPELFPAKVRYSGSGLAYNLAAVTGGAFAPTIATALVTSFGIQALGWYLGIMAVIALVALYFIKESKDVDYEV
ncbi:MAG: MHS family MFS transporter [Eggerthellaceae bacterium]|jgi:MFS family permease|nr:MHS family MFS transporter [Eggerthellaceae bacterium]